jgi:putative ABC transport system ATP-binding protein
MINLSNISKIYKKGNIHTTALNNISLKINQGDFLVIRGKSGSGKTTLLNILSCIDSFQSGEYHFFGRDISSLNEKTRANFRNKEIGIVFQAYNLIDEMTIMENIELPMVYSNIKQSIRIKSVSTLLEKLDISGTEKKYPYQLSGGQQQRVAIARALINRPEIIFADEPTGNLDSENGHQVMDILSRLNKEDGKTIVLVTHDDQVASYAKNEVLLIDGKVQQKN